MQELLDDDGDEPSTEPEVCKHCGAAEGFWFDRSFSLDARGENEIGFYIRCNRCGTPREEDVHKQQPIEEDNDSNGRPVGICIVVFGVLVGVLCLISGIYILFHDCSLFR